MIAENSQNSRRDFYSCSRVKKFFERGVKIPLLDYFFQFLTLADLLKISSMNSFVFNYVSNKKNTKIFKMINEKYMNTLTHQDGGLINTLNNTGITSKPSSLEEVEVLMRKVLFNEKVSISSVIEYFSIYITKYVWKSNFNLNIKNKDSLMCFINIHKHLQFDQENNANLTFTYAKNSQVDFDVLDFTLKAFTQVDCKLNSGSNFISCLLKLNLSGNNFTDLILPQLSPLLALQKKNLESINLSRNQLGNTEISIAFLNLLVNEQTVKEVNLNNNHFNDEAFFKMVEIYNSKSSVKNITANFNNFTITSARYFFNGDESIKTNPNKTFSFSFDKSPFYQLFNHRRVVTLWKGAHNSTYEMPSNYFELYLRGLLISDIHIQQCKSYYCTNLINAIFDNNYQRIKYLEFDYDDITSALSSIYKRISLLTNLETLKITNALKEGVGYYEDDNIYYSKRFNPTLSLMHFLEKVPLTNLKTLKFENLTIYDKTMLSVMTMLLNGRIVYLEFKNLTNYDSSVSVSLYAGLKASKLKILTMKNCNIDAYGVDYLNELKNERPELKINITDQ